MRETEEGTERSAARPGRCSSHPTLPSIATCDVCERSLCLACALPVRGRVVGPECLSALVEDVPPRAAPVPSRPKGDLLIVTGFALVLVLSIWPWARVGAASGYGEAWTVHWSLLAVGAAALGLVAFLAMRRRAVDPRVVTAVVVLFSAAVAVGAVLHAAHPPTLSRANVPWVLAVAGAAVAFVGAVWRALALRPPSIPGL